MTEPARYRTGTTSVTLPTNLTQPQLRGEIENILRAKLAATGESLSKFDYGPPRRSGDAAHRSYDVIFRTGPADADGAGPRTEHEPPRLGA